jgi:homoserine dehydrogenase
MNAASGRTPEGGVRTVNVSLVGMGHVGRNVLRLLEEKRDRLCADYGIEFRVIFAADSSGVAVNPEGFDIGALRRTKELGGHMDELPGFLPNRSPAQALAICHCNLLFEASPVNLQTGEPGLGATRAMLARGANVVLANKAPLVLAFHDLHALGRKNHARLAFSATVCGALPVINILQRDFVAAEIRGLRGIFNSTSNFILGEMEAGRDYDDALAEAQRRGLAETDPSLDVDGWDTANKLVIIANAALGVAVRLEDVAVTGMRKVTSAELAAARADGKTIKLVATAQRAAANYRLTVAPEVVPLDDFLGGCSSWEMGIEVQSDIYGKQYYKVWEREPLPTAAAMLRDAVNMYTDGGA